MEKRNNVKLIKDIRPALAQNAFMINNVRENMIDFENNNKIIG